MPWRESRPFSRREGPNTDPAEAVPRRGRLEIVPVPVCVPVPETRMLSGMSILLLPLCVGRFPSLVALSAFSSLRVIESGTGTGLRPGHGHDLSHWNTAEPVVQPFQIKAKEVCMKGFTGRPVLLAAGAVLPPGLQPLQRHGSGHSERER